MGPHRCARILLLVLLAVALSIGSSGPALGRAGGGEDYGGGDGGGSYGGGDSGWGSSGDSDHDSGDGGEALLELVVFLVKVTVKYPHVCVPLWVLVGFLVYKTSDKIQDSRMTSSIRHGLKAQKELSRAAAEDSLKKRDPAWSSSAFLTRVRSAFPRIQGAWSAQDLSNVQAFISDGVFERFSLQVQEQKDSGVRDHIQDLEVREARIAQIQSDRHFDIVHVYFRASAVDYLVDLKTGAWKQGPKTPTEFEEYWSFLRRPGAKSIAKPGLMEGFCPNCGAPISLSRSAVCEACQSFLRSGEHDWVLAEITQAREWEPREAVNIPGLQGFLAKDPGFNLQHIEDRASVVFWRLVLSERRGNDLPIRKYALETFLEIFALRIRPPESGQRQVFSGCAVGSVEVKAIEPGEPFDRLFVEIRWSGRPTSVATDGTLGTPLGKPQIMRDIFRFVRRSGTVSETRHSLDSSHCPNCGAPEKTPGAFTCEYCETVLNDGSRDWVVEAIFPAITDEFLATLRRLREKETSFFPGLATGATGGPSSAPPSGTHAASGTVIPLATFSGGKSAIRWLTALMLADGTIEERELALIRSMAQKCGVHPDAIDGLVQEVSTLGPKAVGILETPGGLPEGRQLLRTLAELALADGRIEESEMTLMLDLGKRLGLSPADVQMIVGKERSRLFTEARQASKKARNLPPGNS